jgi:hypothetical protein
VTGQFDREISLEEFSMFFRKGLLVAVVAAAMLVTGVVNAAPLGLTLTPPPDIASGFIGVSYNANTNALSASGFALTIQTVLNGPLTNITGNDTYSINATVANNGALLGGNVAIGGNVLGFGPNLLTGTLTSFGYQDPPGGNIFEFLFNVTGGDLATPAYYGLPGSTVGIILDANDSKFTGSFATSWSNDGSFFRALPTGTAHTAPVPEPASLSLLVLVGLLLRRHARR